MSFLSEKCFFRCTHEELEKVFEIVDRQECDGFSIKYESFSHFVRCAVIKLIREEESCSTKLREKRKHGRNTVRRK